MAWATPQNSRSRVDRAGQTIVSELPMPHELDEAMEVVNNWRSSHSFPLNTMQMYLRNKAAQVDSSYLVAQRIKRLSSIEAKLRNESGMQLSRMQDIGGCRAVVLGVECVYELRDLYKAGHLKHRLVKENDYIANPKWSGYRSLHRVYRYTSDRNSTYNGLQIEIQMRSRLQHAWATAVETVGTFLQQSLKASQGSTQWLRFFAVMSSAIAAREGTTTVPGTPGGDGLVAELRRHVHDLDVEDKLTWYHRTLQWLSEPSAPELRHAKYYLLELMPEKGEVHVASYKAGEIQRATAEYMEVERRLTGRGSEAVLVSVESISALRRAYPNYFLDTRVFLDLVQDVVS